MYDVHTGYSIIQGLKTPQEALSQAARFIYVDHRHKQRYLEELESTGKTTIQYEFNSVLIQKV